jgi:hypothetical protein
MKHALRATLILALTAACARPSGEVPSADAAPAQSAAAVHASGTHTEGTARAPGAAAAASALLAVVYKTPTCGCCAKWVDHLKANGYTVEVHDVEQVEPIKAEWGVPAGLASCHTAKVGGYVFEGHVPAEVIQRVLREKPRIAGVAVPGMPMGTPGMEGPYKDRYDVISFDRGGNQKVYESR